MDRLLLGPRIPGFFARTEHRLWRNMLNELAKKCQGLFTMLWREVMKFGVVGGVAFIIDTSIFLWMMNGPMHGSEGKAKIVAGIVAT
ncbi:MAG: hypothetical protein L0J68_12380, partial [Micrococcaceae bacterium]|nr:hypothetical protein [Micrococcaceae bacterium]